MEFPYKITKVKGVFNNKIAKEFPGLTDGLVQVGPEKWILPTSYADFADQIYNFEARPDDVFICTFPRSGTTWTQEMIWLISNNLDYEKALNVQQFERFPFLELHLMLGGGDRSKYPPKIFGPFYEQLEAQTTRRFIKTHLPFNLMPRNIKEVGAKVVYVARNPQDVAVSYYHFQKSNDGYLFTGDFESFATYLMDDLVVWGPYWKHVLDGWSHQHDENVHFMFYETSMLEMESSLKDLASFLGHPLKDEDLPALMNHLQFDNVKKNAAINMPINADASKNAAFVRRGKVGGNPEMTKEMSKKFDDWSKKNLEKSDLKFPNF